MVIILALLFVMGIFICGALAWYSARSRGETENDPQKLAYLRARYIAAPLAVFVISQVLLVYFYDRIPDMIAFRFTIGGVPDGGISREALVIWGIVIQAVLLIIGTAIVASVIKVVNRMGEMVNYLEGFLVFMGNVVALPQIVLIFATADIIGYNSTQKHFLPLWVILLVVLGLGTIVLTGVSVWMVMRARKKPALS